MATLDHSAGSLQPCTAAYTNRPACGARLESASCPRALSCSASSFSVAMARKCPRCGCSDVRRSTIHSVDEEQLHVFLSPYRCNECDERFWVISRRARQMAIGLLVLAVTGVTIALLM